VKLATIQGPQRVLYDTAAPGEFNIHTCRSLRDRAGIVLTDVDNRAPKSPVRSRFSCGIRIYARSNARTPRTGHLRRTFPLNSRPSSQAFPMLWTNLLRWLRIGRGYQCRQVRSLRKQIDKFHLMFRWPFSPERCGSKNCRPVDDQPDAGFSCLKFSQ